MAMNVGSADGGEEQLNNTINTTPLVDVMLVLLIIFLITIPVVTQSIKLELPKERNLPRRPSPRTSSSRSTATARSTGAWSACPTTRRWWRG
jgi:biopolymer transport protein ExbD